jgi:hypothetical protein
VIFSSFNIQPSYGRESVFLTWTIPGYEDGDIYVYRSPTGIPVADDWELLNENDPVQDVNFYADSTFYDKHDFRKWYYRLLLVHDDQEHDSPIVGMFFEALNKTEYGLLYTMRRREFLRMRQGNGVRVFHCIPSTTGPKAEAYNSISGKNMAQCDNDDSLGTLFDQGFRTCFQTWAEISQAGPQQLEQLQDGAGFNEVQKFRIRLLAFPQPEQGHVIVLPASDQRFIVDGEIQPYLFKGFAPVAYDVQASYLSKSDPRHRLEMPTPLPDPDYPVSFTRAL